MPESTMLVKDWLAAHRVDIKNKIVLNFISFEVNNKLTMISDQLNATN